MSSWNLDAPLIDAHTRYLLSCARGMRSKMLAGNLRERGCTNVFSLIGGAEVFKVHASM